MRVYILIINDRTGGTSVSVHKTEVGARESLYDYVREWWGEEMPGEEMSDNQDQAIDRYFEYMTDRAYPEDYLIEEVKLEG